MGKFMFLGYTEHSQALDVSLRHSDWLKSASRIAQNSWQTSVTYALF